MELIIGLNYGDSLGSILDHCCGSFADSILGALGQILRIPKDSLKGTMISMAVIRGGGGQSYGSCQLAIASN